MKNLFLLLCTIFLIGACQDAPKENESALAPVKINGQFDNAKSDIVNISVDGETAKVELKEGAFEYAFESDKPTVVTVWNGPKVARLYTEPGAVVNLSVDVADEESKMNIEGDFSKENNFWSNLKANYPLPGYQDLYGQSESDFVKTLDDHTKEMKAGLDELIKGDKVSTKFKKMAVIDFEYNRANQLSQYGSYHEYVTATEGYVVSDTINNELKSVSLDNEDNLISPSYQNYVYSRIMEQSWDEIQDDEEAQEDGGFSHNSVRIMDEKLKSPKVKDYVFFRILDDMFVDGLQRSEEALFERYKSENLNPAYVAVISEKYNKWSKLQEGKPAPSFNYVDINGNEVGLEDLKGKVVYVDVWATWCGPCRAEHPSLHALEKEYEQNANVAFVGVSIDEDKEAWRKMVEEKEMGGTQLISDKAWDSAITKDYLIEGIPRFIMIDQEGMIMNASAPRPSSGKVQTIIDEQLKAKTKEA